MRHQQTLWMAEKESINIGGSKLKSDFKEFESEWKKF